MNRGLFAAQINKAEELLHQLRLIEERNKQPKYDNYGAAFFRGKPYPEVWRYCYDRAIYDFRLVDDSLFQFRADRFPPSSIAYVYLDCPYVKPISYEEFAESLIDEELDGFELIRQYEFYANNPKTKEFATPIRYDYSPGLYTEGRHPASHVHFGHGNQIRVGSRKILRPLSFVLFIIRQHYPASWKIFLTRPDAETLCRNVRIHPNDIHADYWRPLDELEMVLA